MRWVCAVKTRKNICITIYRQWNNGHRSARQTNLMLAMAQHPPHGCWLQGEAGGDAGESAGREIWGPYLSCNWGHGVPHKHTMVMCWWLVARWKSMVSTSLKYAVILIWVRGTRWWRQNWRGGHFGGVISILKVLEMGPLYRPWPTRRWIIGTRLYIIRPY
jgi:hypothetical protein